MYRRTYICQLNKPGAIVNAIEFLKAEKRLLEGRIWMQFLHRLGQKMVKFLNDEYGSNHIAVDYTIEDKKRLIVTASGERLMFVEFGAGVPADSSEGVRYGFGAGSWSKEHENTYQKWLDSGGVEYSDENGRYLYDRQAKDAFMRLELALHRLIQESADEVYGKR